MGRPKRRGEGKTGEPKTFLLFRRGENPPPQYPEGGKKKEGGINRKEVAIDMEGGGGGLSHVRKMGKRVSY